VLLVGLTVIAAVVALVFQLYVPPPEAVNVVLFPLQILVEAGETEAVAGEDELIVTVVVAVLHPVGSEMVTVYVPGASPVTV
jgi:hypothetical protein